MIFSNQYKDTLYLVQVLYSNPRHLMPIDSLLPIKHWWRVLVQVQQCLKKREFSAKRGSRTRRRGTVMPLRGYLLKNNVAVLLCIVPSLSLFRPCFDLFCFDLRQAPHSLSVGFAKNLCSRSQHVIRARRSKHVVQKKSINHWVKKLLLSKERSGKIKSQGWNR